MKALFAQMQIEGESNFFEVPSNGKATQFLEELTRKEEEQKASFPQMGLRGKDEDEKTLFKRRKLTYEDDSSEVQSIQYRENSMTISLGHLN